MNFLPPFDTVTTAGCIYSLLSIFCLLFLLVGYYFLFMRDRRSFWHHAVRLPTLMDEPHWYLVSVTTGCRPWAGHEGDIFIRLIGTKSQSRTLLVNSEIFSRLWEADSHLCLYSSRISLGDLQFCVVACSKARRRKRWFLGSVQVKYVTSNPDKAKSWYFPYHNWIEVYRDPVKVTLSGVHAEHDLYRRLIIGWLGRSFTNFHLWTSIMGPVKYTLLKRSDRVGCITAQTLGSLTTCVLLHSFFPTFGSILLGIYSATLTSIPVYAMEVGIRYSGTKLRVIIEDLTWYKVAEEGIGTMNRPQVYDLFLKEDPEDEDKIDYDEVFDIPKEPEKLPAVRSSKKFEDIFGWLDPELAKTEDPSQHKLSKLDVEFPKSSDTNLVHEKFENEKNEKIEGKDDGPKRPGFVQYMVHDAMDTLVGKFNKLKEMLKSSEPEEASDHGNYSLVDEEIAQEVNVGFLQENNVFIPEMRDEKNEPEIEETQPQTKLVALGGGYFVDPISVWEVDSDYSVESLDMNALNMQRFKIMETMPASEFEKLRNDKQEEESAQSDARGPSKKFGTTKRRMAVADLGNTVPDPIKTREADADSGVSSIGIPDNIFDLCECEKELVNWVYNDSCTNSNQWLKPGYPVAAALAVSDEVAGLVDWKSLYDPDVDDYLCPKERIARKEILNYASGDDPVRRQFAILELRSKYPEPVPRERIFNMLMYPEFVSRFSEFFVEVTSNPEGWSALAELYAEFAECKNGPYLFSEMCIHIADTESGQQALRCAISCGRTSTAWTSLVCELTQRLRFQGDNVERLKEKYGFDSACMKNAFLSDKQDACRIPEMQETKERCCEPSNMGQDERKISKDTSGSILLPQKEDLAPECAFDELERISEWRKKLTELEISMKFCPLDSMTKEQALRMSRFYRSMLLTKDGCLLFGELLRQIAMGNDQGRHLISKLVRYMSGHRDGVPRLNAIQMALSRSGPDGRLLLNKMYEAIADQPNGKKVLSSVTDLFHTTDSGKMLIDDLQLEASKAHRVAQQIKQDIKVKMEPLIKSARRNICQLIQSMNEVAKYMLEVSHNARDVVEPSFDDDEEDLGIEIDVDDGERFRKGLHGVNNQEWETERNCCRHNYGDAPQKQQKEKPDPKPKPKKEGDSPDDEYFNLSDTEYNKPSYNNKGPLISELWKPLDARDDVINIYPKVKNSLMKLKSPAKDCNMIPGERCIVKSKWRKNEFFLQSKDYETFSMEFRYQRGKRFKDIAAKTSNSTVARHWEKEAARRRGGFARESLDLPDIVEKWGRSLDDIEEEDGEKTPPHLCICTKEDGCTCFICRMARNIEDAENSDEAMEILEEDTKSVPLKSLSKLKSLPRIIERSEIDDQNLVSEADDKIDKIVADTIKIEKSTHTVKRSTIPVHGGTGKNETDTPDPSSCAPMPSARPPSPRNSTSPIDKNDCFPMPSGRAQSDNDSSGDVPYPSTKCGSSKPYNPLHSKQKVRMCECVKDTKSARLKSTEARQFEKVMLSRHNPSRNDILWRDKEAQPKQDKTTAASELRCCSKKKEINIPDAVQPVIAKYLRRGRFNVQFNSEENVAHDAESYPSLPTRTMDYHFPANFELKWPPDKDDTEYWAQDNASVSVFSNPALGTHYECCKVCGGIEAVDESSGKDEPVYRYFSQRDKGTRFKEDISSTSIDSNASHKSREESESEDWKNARQCNTNPGCWALPPKGAHYRHYYKLLKKAQLERNSVERTKIINDIEVRYRQWLTKSPCGKYICTGEKDEKEPPPHGSQESVVPSSLRKNESVILSRPRIRLVDSEDKLIDKTTNKPLTAKIMDIDQLQDQSCDVLKLPKFNCCELHRDPKDDKDYGCLCHDDDLAVAGGITDDFRLPSTKQQKPHSVCSECHLRIGTEQRPPCIRYLLPLKVVRCYEDMLRRYHHSPAMHTESGMSIHTANDMLNEEDLEPVREDTQFTLLKLMGLTGRQRVKKKQRSFANPPSECDSQQTMSVGADCSICSTSEASSGQCCHVHQSRILPILHLQGFTCAYNAEFGSKEIPVLSAEWWHAHSDSLHAMQTCVDACVCLQIVLAHTREDAITEHEKTCRVCATMGGTPFDSDGMSNHSYENHAMGTLPVGPRYSEYLPILWKPEIRGLGNVGERSKEQEDRVPHFYKELISAIAESTRIMLLTTDLKPDELHPSTSVQDRLRGDRGSVSDDASEISRARERGEDYITKQHVNRLAKFRALMKSLNDIQNEGTKLRKSNLISDFDVTQAILRQQQEDDLADEFGEEAFAFNDSLLDMIIQFIKCKACGSIYDCREMLDDPWKLPKKDQHIIGRLLKQIDSFTSIIEADSKISVHAIHELSTWEQALAAIVETYLREAAFRATSQNTVDIAIKGASCARKGLAKLAHRTKLSVAKILRFGELVQAATANLKVAIKEGLASVDDPVKKEENTVPEENKDSNETAKREPSGVINESFMKSHIGALLRTGRDDRRATLDDVFIMFERLRRHIRTDLNKHGKIVKEILSLEDTRINRKFTPLFDDNLTCRVRRKKPCIDPWSESDVNHKCGGPPVKMTASEIAAARRLCSHAGQSSNFKSDLYKMNNKEDESSSCGCNSEDCCCSGATESDEVGIVHNKSRRKSKHKSKMRLMGELKEAETSKLDVSRNENRRLTEIYLSNATEPNVDSGVSEYHHAKSLLSEDSRYGKTKLGGDSSFPGPSARYLNNDIVVAHASTNPANAKDNLSESRDDFYSADAKSNGTYGSLYETACNTVYSFKSAFSMSSNDGYDKPTLFRRRDVEIETHPKQFASTKSPSINHVPAVSTGIRGKKNDNKKTGKAVNNRANAIDDLMEMLDEEKSVQFNNVFERSSSDEIEVEAHTKKKLRADKGVNMLENVFGKPMTDEEMVRRFHDNLRSLMSFQQPLLPPFMGKLLRGALALFAVLSGLAAALIPLYMGTGNASLIFAVPFIILTHAFFLEPLKSVIAAWTCFFFRFRPAFYNAPTYIKSNRALVEKSQLSQPRFSEDKKVDQTYYNMFCENRSNEKTFDRRRRTLPVVTQSDLSLDLKHVESYDALHQAKPSAAPPKPPTPIISSESAYSFVSYHLPDDIAEIEEYKAVAGFRRNAVDKGGHRSSSSESIVVTEQKPVELAMQESSASTVEDSSSPTDSGDKHPKIIYCSNSNKPNFRRRRYDILYCEK